MVGMGLVMLAISWFGNWLRWRGRLETTRWFLWCAFLRLADRLRRGAHRLVHGRSRAPALGRVGPAAHRRRHDAHTDRAASARDAHRLRGRLRVHLCVRRSLHLPPAARRSDRCQTQRRRRRPAIVRWRRQVLPRRRPAISLRRDEDGPGLARQLLGRRDRLRDPGLRHPRRLRPRRRHPVRHDRKRTAPGHDDERDRALLGRQRNVAGPGRRRALCGVSRWCTPSSCRRSTCRSR